MGAQVGGEAKVGGLDCSVEGLVEVDERGSKGTVQEDYIVRGLARQFQFHSHHHRPGQGARLLLVRLGIHINPVAWLRPEAGLRRWRKPLHRDRGGRHQIGRHQPLQGVGPIYPAGGGDGDSR
ncbi:hypothetical protein TthTF19_02480 [Thermus thermophilus]